MEDSFAKSEVLDYREYLCNYQRVRQPANGLFGGLNILFATTSMSTKKLQTLLSLGEANILKTEQQINDESANKNERIMICMNEIERDEAKKFSAKYNCRVIGESWLVKCIYPNETNLSLIKQSTQPYIDYYAMEPIVERIGFEEYDQTQKQSDDESDDYDDDFY